jgi:hypothetical protein
MPPIFDYPYGQKLAPPLKSEMDRLRQLEKLLIPDEVAERLKEISPATIDRKLLSMLICFDIAKQEGYGLPR